MFQYYHSGNGVYIVLFFIFNLNPLAVLVVHLAWVSSFSQAMLKILQKKLLNNCS